MQIANWTDENNGINPVSYIRWCTQGEFTQLNLCEGAYKLRCIKKVLPPRALPSSPYNFDYSRYTFDVVTVMVHLIAGNFQGTKILWFHGF